MSIINTIKLRHGLVTGLGFGNSPVFYPDDPPDEMPFVPGAGSSASTPGPGATAYPTGYVYGLGLSWTDATHIAIAVGNCRDILDAANMTLGSSVTVNTATKDAIQGNVRKTLTGTVACSVSTVTGTGTHFLTEFQTRAGNGTITTSGTAVTGTSTLFLSQLSVGDLIGNTANGYGFVTAIASNTSATINATLPGGNISVGAAYNIIESPTITLASTVRAVTTIASDTSLTVQGSQTLGAGATAFAGDLIGSGANSVTGNFLHLWLVSGGSGTGVIISTQRTTPWMPTGYTTSYRRLGGVVLDPATGNVLSFRQKGNGHDRWTILQVANAGFNTRLQNGGNSNGAWAAPVTNQGSATVPQTVDSINVTLQVNPTVATAIGYVRPRGIGDAAASRNFYTQAVASGSSGNTDWVDTDGAQCIEYATTSGTTNLTIDVNGYHEAI